MTVVERFKKWWCGYFGIDTRPKVLLPLDEYVFYMNVPRQGYVNIDQLAIQCNWQSDEAMRWVNAIRSVHERGLVDFWYELNNQFYKTPLDIPDEEIASAPFDAHIVPAYSRKQDLNAIWDRQDV